jgi:hypothetical protein
MKKVYCTNLVLSTFQYNNQSNRYRLAINFSPFQDDLDKKKNTFVHQMEQTGHLKFVMLFPRNL